jgi:hypothetical protein
MICYTQPESTAKSTSWKIDLNISGIKSDKIPISWFQMVSDGIKTAAPRLLGGLLPGRKAEELFRGGTGLEEKRTRDSGRLATKMVG